jgi:hypothetical protein
MDGENNLDLRVSHFIPEGTEDKEEGVRKVEKWLTERHDGRFHSVFVDESDKSIKIKAIAMQLSWLRLMLRNFRFPTF